MAKEFEPPLFSYNSHGARRSPFERTLDTLIVIKSGEDKPTNIMYETHIPYAPMKKILNYLKGKELIHEYIEHKNETSKIRLRITEKGVLCTFYVSKLIGLME